MKPNTPNTRTGARRALYLFLGAIMLAAEIINGIVWAVLTVSSALHGRPGAALVFACVGTTLALATLPCVWMALDASERISRTP